MIKSLKNTKLKIIINKILLAIAALEALNLNVKDRE